MYLFHPDQRRRAIAMFVFVLVGLSAAKGVAATFTVSPEGTAAGADCEDATVEKGLQACLDRSLDNGEPDTIEILPGSYVGRFVYFTECPVGVSCVESLDLVGIDRPKFSPGAGHPVLPVLLVKTNNGEATIRIRGIDFDGSDSPNAVKALSVELNNTNFELSDCRISQFKNGGAIIFAHGEGNEVVVSRNVFSFNDTVLGLPGGGIGIRLTQSQDFHANTLVEFTDNLLVGNTSIGSGGGADFQISNGSLFAANNVFYFNDAFDAGEAESVGGGLSLNVLGEDSSAALIHNTVFDNFSESFGSGMAVSVDSAGQRVDIYNNIVYGNGSEGSSDLFFAVPDALEEGQNPPVVLAHNLFFDLARQGAEEMIDASDNLTDVIAPADLFANAVEGDLHLREGSPAIDRGTTEAPLIPVLDFDGNDRTLDIPDLGAFEFQPEQPVPSPEAPPSDGPSQNPGDPSPGTGAPQSPGAENGNSSVNGGGCSLGAGDFTVYPGFAWAAIAGAAALSFLRRRGAERLLAK